MKTLNIGKLNKRITVMCQQDMEDEMGQSTKKLQAKSVVWGTLYPVRGAEFYELQKIQSRVTHKCYLRYREDIDTNSILVYAGKQYSVTSVLDVGLEHKMLEIMCCEYTNKDVM